VSHGAQRQKAWNEPRDPAAEDAFVKQAQDNVRAKNEATRQNLLHLQGLEIKHLESERKWIAEQKARDVSALNAKEIAGINNRYDRQQHRLEQRHNRFWGKMHRLVGGHKSQQRQISRLNGERDRIVGERSKQHVLREAQRQRSLTERDLRVEQDLQQAREKHSEAREKQRQNQEHGFDHAVKQEMNRLRQVQQPRQRM
jgi:hypothetical protein